VVSGSTEIGANAKAFWGGSNFRGIGYDATTVWVIADLEVTRNMHEITVTGEFWALTVRVENVPSPEDPKMSYIAMLSAITTLKKLTEPVWMET
jgi:aspartate dehydrogenase